MYWLRLLLPSSKVYVPLSKWWSQAGSNCWPPACKAGALPAELWPRFTQVDAFTSIFSHQAGCRVTVLLHTTRYLTQSKKDLVGLGRLELPTSPLSGVRSNQLSYKPISCFHLRENNSWLDTQALLLLFFIKTKQSVWTLNEARSAVIVRRWSNPRFP